jgi:hypothetical protein
VADRAFAFVVSFTSLLAALFYAAVTVGWGCHGSDASSAPIEGSIGDQLCVWPAAALHVGLGLVAVGAPIVAVNREPTRRRVATAFAVSSGAIATLAIVGALIQSWNDFLFVVPVLVILFAALLYRRRQSA